ncbi:Os06g0196500 [Oryza sativa Japonica Group]|uniref:Os06g0196500 protein n=1 Tax=Oryza sativa subsp. japonica TaxID=39947 RepID=C7J3R3_ORYSJ|nr:Os06g0196500 [Oryza sativa Japonica Group]|eukprot:NP_001174650.1 Os06g0196500 [Oryza sativa Japonica Group]
MRGGGGDDDLWAKAAELERQFEGYKRRVAERRSSSSAAAADRHDGDGDGGAVEVVAVGKGRRYDAYVRRRDEKLRQGWRARMERKEAEMKALWARLDVDRRRDGDLAAGNGKQQKPGNLEARPAASPATPRSSSATKATLSRPRTTPRTTTPSPAGAAASPRLSSSNPDARRRAPPQPEPPSTPRKENRVPSAAAASTAAATATPRLRALSRSRSSLKESASSVRDSPRRAPPPPRRSHDGDAGDRPKQQPEPVHAATTTADDAVAPAARSCQSQQQVVLAEIKAAAAFRLRRSGNGAAQGRQPAASPRPVITRQLDGRRKPSDRNSDVEAKNFNLDEGIGEDDDDDTAQSSVEIGSLKITGDSDTEPSYVYITKDIDDEAMNTSQPQPLAASDSNAEEPESLAPHQSEKETRHLEETAMAASSEATAKERPATDREDDSPQSSDQSFYSNVDSSFSHRSELELAASATDSPLHGSPSSTGPSTEQLLEADAAMLRKKREEEEEEEEDEAAAGEINSLLIPSTTTSSSSSVACPVTVQSPMEAVAGFKRFLTFGKKNAAAAVAPPADDSGVGHGWPSGDSGVRQRICSSDAASDDSDNSYVIPAHGNSVTGLLQFSSNQITSVPIKYSTKGSLI